ncbi:MAG TPA: anaerobic ribonucleoside-triphosphate reductase activating protein [Chitinophagales bacterium]|nr:anaerobic ribonucleoside-triphosphate reductase activating protein [Chitinophagales bacterium]HRK25734.1 anaerobic ribonucleoside-triphosphate reductase activating protein [Chitinophagales bacterium]
MNIYHIEPTSHIYGPGCRFVIWTQGCSLRCKGCWNTETWAFNRGHLYSTEQLIDQILAQKEYIEGVTILGGEPFDQYQELLELCQSIKAHNLTIMLYTGYEMDELQQKAQTGIINHLDILITGRFIESKKNVFLQWIGSDNQQIHFLSDAYANYKLDNGNYIEVIIDEELGQTNFVGFVNRAEVKKILS